MGLDMHLLRCIRPALAEALNKPFAIGIQLTMDGKNVPIDTGRIEEINVEVGYWRKANQVHRWFVENCREEVKNCERAEVDYDDLLKLKELCKEVVSSKDRTMLPSQEGLFFGSTDDKWYYPQLEDTMKIIDALDPAGDYYYRPSW